jgi:geranylgeranyl diphosphate synthase, type II
MFVLNDYLEEKQSLIDHSLNYYFDSQDLEDPLVKAMSYSLMAGGKRLRPILCIAASEAINGAIETVIPVACALEMIHTYSLIHDDLPAMDNDQLRRGKLTCHVAFNEATAILAGDALLTLAFQILTATAQTDPQPAKWLEVINGISVAAGHQGMIQGQMRDMNTEANAVNITELEQLHLLKTGALIEVSVTSSVILSNGNDQQIQSLKDYSKSIGLAFQVMDDILNVEGDPMIMGKAKGTDHDRKKNTYPDIMGMPESKAFAKELIDNALNAIDTFDRKADPLRALAQYVINRNK